MLDCLPPNCLNVQYPLHNHHPILGSSSPQTEMILDPWNYLTRGIISHLSPVIFHFLSALINKMFNFFAVITSAFVLIYSLAGNSRALYIWAVVKPAPAPKSSTWFEVELQVCTVSLVNLIIKILSPRSECAIILVSSVVPYILCTLVLVSK